jgi:hypothetical protein
MFHAQARINYLFDGRRSLDSTVDDGTGAFLFNNGHGNTSNWRINGVTTGSSGSLVNTARVAGDVVSFDTVAQPDGVIAIGSRFNATESLANIAMREIVITDANGTHVIDMSSSNGTAMQFTSTDGQVTLKLFNFNPATCWIYYEDNVSKVGLGWSGTQQYTTLRQWLDARKTINAHQTALCRGDLGNSSVAVVAADFPQGALIRTDGVQYTGNNHTQLALLRNPLTLAASSVVVAQDLFIQQNSGTVYSAVSGSPTCKLLRCYVEHTGASIGVNAGVISAQSGGVVENCIGQATRATTSRALRPSGAGVLLNCVGIGAANAIQSEWTNTRTERCYAVGSSSTSYLWNNGRPPANSNNASQDGSGDAGFQNLDPATQFVDYANGDYRIRSSSPLNSANIGAFFEAPAAGSSTTVNINATYPAYTGSVTASRTLPVYNTNVSTTYPNYTNITDVTNIRPVRNINISVQYPNYTSALTATNIKPGLTANIVANYPVYTASVNSNNTKPIKTVQVSTTYSSYTASVLSTNIKPVKTVNINTQYPVYVGSVVATRVVVGYSATINTTYPNYIGSVTNTNSKPIKTLNINTTYPIYSSTVVNTNTKPIKNITVTATYSSYTANVTARAVNTNELSINTTYPKYTSSVICGSVVTERTVTINTTYPKYVGNVVIGDFVNLPYRAGKGAHLVISLGSREVVIKDKSRNVKWRVENARL